MVATEVFAEPWLLGIGPMTAGAGSAAGADLGADLQAAISAAAVLAASAINQKRRGAPASVAWDSLVKLEMGWCCLIFLALN